MVGEEENYGVFNSTTGEWGGMVGLLVDKVLYRTLNIKRGSTYLNLF